MSDLIDIAAKEVGYREGAGNRTKFGEYTNSNGAAWCHSFVSWCAKEAGISTAIVPKTASTTIGMNWFQNKKRFKVKGSYTPKRNDLVYFKTGRSHVGIVEKVSGNMLHTIEGNSSDMVKRKSYFLSEKTITGYGIVSSYIDSSGETDTDKKDKKKKKEGKDELAYLKKALKKAKQDSTAPLKETSFTIQSVNPRNKVEIELLVKHNKKFYDTPAADGMKVTWERKDTPGKLTFTTVSKKLSCGDEVSLKINKKPFFFGYIFELKPKTDGTVDVTVYDQLRYFKNKDSYIYKKKTATKLLRMIAGDFQLKTGTIAKTKHSISRVDMDQTLFDIMQNALDETTWATGKIYTLYDNYGKLMLREPWKVNIMIDEETGQEYDYSISIDRDYYNQVKLVYENKDTNKLDVYISKSSKAINKYGVLQYYEKIDSPKLGKLKGKMLLKMYKKVSRTLSITGAVGSVKVRAGCLLPVIMKLYDRMVSSYLLVDRVTHTFNNGQHTMDLDVSGGDFDGDQ